MKTNDFVLGLIVGLPVGAFMAGFNVARSRFGWPSGEPLGIIPIFVALFLAIAVSNLVRKSAAGARLRVAATDVPVESLFVEFVGMIMAALVVCLIAFSLF